MYNKVELCGMNTAQLPVLTEAEKRELLARVRAALRSCSCRPTPGMQERGNAWWRATCGWC